MDISQEIRSLVIEKFKEGVKQKDICMHLKLKKSAVSKLIKRYKTTGSVSSRRKGRCGRKSSLSDRDMRKIYSKSTSDPWLTAREVQTSVGGNSANLTVRTIRNYLRRMGRFTLPIVRLSIANSVVLDVDGVKIIKLGQKINGGMLYFLTKLQLSCQAINVRHLYAGPRVKL